MFTVFISHSSVDRGFVEAEILPLFRRDGLQPWYSMEAIRAADDWERSILAGLRSSDWVAVVLSPEAITSEWVKREVDWAMSERSKRILPILFRTCRVEDLDARLRAVQYVDFRSDIPNARLELSALWDDFMLVSRGTMYHPGPPHASRDRRSRVFFNNGWDGFSIETDKDVLFYLSLTSPTRLVRHIELMRQYRPEVYSVSERGLAVRPRSVPNPYEFDATLSVCFGSSLTGRQSEPNYCRTFRTYDPPVPKAVGVVEADGNAEAMWSWSAPLPRSWLLADRPFISSEGKSQLRSVVDTWVSLHNGEIEKIKKARRS